MWIEFDNFIAEIVSVVKPRETQSNRGNYEIIYVLSEINEDGNVEYWEFFETEAQAQERYEEIKYLLTGKNDKWYFVKVNDENEGIVICKFPIKKERNKWLKENEAYMEIIQIWEQEEPLQMVKYSTLQDVKAVREKVKELFFEDIKLINLRSAADNALLQIEEILKEKEKENEEDE